MNNIKNTLLHKIRAVEKTIVERAAQRNYLEPLMRRAFIESGIFATTVVNILWSAWYQNDEIGAPPDIDRHNTPIDKFKITLTGKPTFAEMSADVLLDIARTCLPTLDEMYQNAKELGWNAALEETQERNARWWELALERNNAVGSKFILPPFHYVVEKYGVAPTSR